MANESASEGLELRAAAGRWKWSFVDRDEGVEVQSNEDYPDADAARHAALRAFPDLRFFDAPASSAPRRARRPFLFLAVASVTFIGLLFLLVRSE